MSAYHRVASCSLALGSPLSSSPFKEALRERERERERMIPRSKSRVFTAVDEGSGEAAAVAARWGTCHLVGLRILIQSPSSPEPANFVAKSSSVRLPSASPASFLSACGLCNKHLTLLDEVYMYRGDQAFCSVECRYRQMMQDERRELEAAVRARLPTPPRQRSGRRLRDSDRRRQILAVS